MTLVTPPGPRRDVQAFRAEIRAMVAWVAVGNPLLRIATKPLSKASGRSTVNSQNPRTNSWHSTLITSPDGGRVMPSSDRGFLLVQLGQVVDGSDMPFRAHEDLVDLGRRQFASFVNAAGQILGFDIVLCGSHEVIVTVTWRYRRSERIVHPRAGPSR